MIKKWITIIFLASFQQILQAAGKESPQALREQAKAERKAAAELENAKQAEKLRQDIEKAIPKTGAEIEHQQILDQIRELKGAAKVESGLDEATEIARQRVLVNKQIAELEERANALREQTAGIVDLREKAFMRGRIPVPVSSVAEVPAPRTPRITAEPTTRTPREKTADAFEEDPDAMAVPGAQTRRTLSARLEEPESEESPSPAASSTISLRRSSSISDLGTGSVFARTTSLRAAEIMAPSQASTSGEQLTPARPSIRALKPSTSLSELTDEDLPQRPASRQTPAQSSMTSLAGAPAPFLKRGTGGGGKGAVAGRNMNAITTLEAREAANRMYSGSVDGGTSTPARPKTGTARPRKP